MALSTTHTNTVYRLAVGALVAALAVGNLDFDSLDQSPRQFAVLVGLILSLALAIGCSRAFKQSRWPNYAMLTGLILVSSATAIVSIGDASYVVMAPVSASFIYFNRRERLITLMIVVAVVSGVEASHHQGGELLLYLAMENMVIAFFVGVSWLIVRERDARLSLQVMTKELADANLRLSQSAKRIAELSQQAERRRIAMELHDSLGHHLTVAHMQLLGAEALAGEKSTSVLTGLGKAKEAVKNSISELRDAVKAMNAPRPETLGEALSRLVSDARLPQFDVALEVEGSPRALPSKVQLALFKTAQEAVTNAAKHANANIVSVKLAYGPKQVALRVCDNGSGVLNAGNGNGLNNIDRRMAAIAGKVTYGNQPTGGFLLEVSVSV